MNKFFYFLFIFVAVGIIGLSAGFFLQGGATACTEMYCECQQKGELPCNSCSSEDPVFALGIVNVINVCNSREILICRNNQPAEVRYSIEGGCKTEVRWFDFVLHYVD